VDGCIHKVITQDIVFVEKIIDGQGEIRDRPVKATIFVE
jgi:hypothetical protein